MSRRNRAKTRKRVATVAPTVSKATREQRESKAQIGTVGIEQVRRVVEFLKPIELSQANKYRTYQMMMLDDAVFTGVDSRRVLISRSQDKGYISYNKNSEESKKVKDFFQYCLDNLDGQTPRGIGETCADMIINSMALFNKVFDKGADEYIDKWVLKKLVYIHPLTLDPVKPFVVDVGGDKYSHVRQASSAFMGTGDGYRLGAFGASGVKDIPWSKICYTAYASTYSQILGNSPLDSCYTAWREKILLQEITNVGVTKDMAGMPVIEIPLDILDKAASDPESTDARMVEGLQNAMANMHTGDQSFVILPSDAQESAGGLRQYNLRFLGVEGGLLQSHP